MNSSQLTSALDVGVDSGTQRSKRKSTIEEHGAAETVSLGSQNSLNSADTVACVAEGGATKASVCRKSIRDTDEGAGRRRKSNESAGGSSALSLPPLPPLSADTVSEQESELLSVLSAQMLYVDPDLDIEPELPSPERLIPEAIWKKYDKRERERQKILHGPLSFH